MASAEQSRMSHAAIMSTPPPMQAPALLLQPFTSKNGARQTVSQEGTYPVLPNGAMAEEMCTHHALPQSQAIGTFPQQTGNPALYRVNHCTQRFVMISRSDYSDYGHPCCVGSPLISVARIAEWCARGLNKSSIGATAF